MRIESRYQRQDHGAPTLRGLVLVAECQEESRMIDECFGNVVLDGDGLIAKVSAEVEVRLSDGYGDHYIYIKKPNELPAATPIKHSSAR
jgi:hypothetical protein